MFLARALRKLEDSRGVEMTGNKEEINKSKKRGLKGG